MAYCVVSRVIDTDGDGVRLSCVVHCHYAPCPLNGEPAASGPLHCDDQTGRDNMIRMWEQRTHRQRTLVIHRGTLCVTKQHALGARSFDCWCEPEVIRGE